MTQKSRNQIPPSPMTDVLADLATTSLRQQRVYKQLGHIPNALGTLYTYWRVGCTDSNKYEPALKAGRVEQDIPVKRSEYFTPVIEPTLSTRTQAIVVAALTYLAK